MIGFLSPEGEYIECTSWEHTSKAHEICVEKFGESFSNGVSAEDYLLSLGYLVIRARDAYMTYWNKDQKAILLTDIQISWLTSNAERFNEWQKKDMNEILFDQEDLRKRHSRS